DKRKYLDSRMPTEPILFQYDKIEVLTEDGFVPLKAISRHRIETEDDKLLIIETEDGNVLRVTRSHPVILADGSIKRADELKEGDELLSTDLSINLSEDIELQNDFAYLIGFMIAEGCWGHQTKEYSIVSQKKNTEEREKIEEILKKLGIPYSENNEFNIVFSTTRMGRYIRNHLRLQSKSYKKNLPTFIFSLKRESIGAIISGLIDGDGNIDRGSVVRIHSTSYTLLMQLKTLLGALGINATVRYALNKSGEKWRDAYVLRFRVDKDILPLFNQSIKLRNIKPKKKASPKFSTKVTKVLEAKHNSEYVYDITTENQHFLISNIVVHNSNFDTYLAPFIRYDGLSQREVEQALQEFFFNMNVPTRVGFQCLSEDTKILTPEGWKAYDQVKIGDLIYTFNLETQKLELKPVKDVFVRKYKGKMYNLRNRTQDQLISPRHRVVRQVFNSKKYRMEPIEKIATLKSPIPIPVLGENDNPDLDVSDEELKLIAWILSEGSIEKNGSRRVSIYQSKNANPEKYEEIISLLKHFNFEFDVREQSGWSTCQHIRLSPTSSKTVHEWLKGEKTFPKWLYRLSKRQARIFLETYIKGNGWKEKYRNRIITTSEDILEGLEALAVLAGFNFSTR
ncbi:hypothetical protein H5T51_05190, partial [Candidatus Bathyarchaeota archaeon]|nr:hypothetical protein [Candidatus Bathyarchaeota archaeon]